jgi:hypothetical protein
MLSRYDDENLYLVRVGGAQNQMEDWEKSRS